jgi:endonuclease G
MKTVKSLSLWGLTLLLAFVASCAPVVRQSRVAPAPITKYRVLHAAPSPEETARIERLCLFGMPVLNPEWHPGPVTLICRDGYVLQHSSQDKIPRWVCERVTAAQLTGNAKDRDLFKPDPLLKPPARAELADYNGSGYDRGHQAPAADQKSSQTLKDETYFLSNMAPQKPLLNERIWEQLESLVRTWVKPDREIWITTGGFFYDPAEEDERTADGLIPHDVIGKNAVVVPTHFYKIAVARSAAGKWQAIAFILENRPYPKPYDFSKYIVPIRTVEAKAGINFMPDMDPAAADRLETQPGSLADW